jgi:hypothetical protein
MVTSATRKPVSQLTLDDLKAFQIWEYCLDEEGVDGQDETWVRPLEGAAIPAEAWSLQVAAEFTLRDGTKFAGFVDLTTAPMDDLVPVLGEDALQPGAVLIVKGQHVCVPTKAAYDYTESRDKLANVLARDLDLIFPLEYQLSVPVVGEQQPRRGNLL